MFLWSVLFGCICLQVNCVNIQILFYNSASDDLQSVRAEWRVLFDNCSISLIVQDLFPAFYYCVAGETDGSHQSSTLTWETENLPLLYQGWSRKYQLKMMKQLFLVLLLEVQSNTLLNHWLVRSLIFSGQEKHCYESQEQRVEQEQSFLPLSCGQSNSASQHWSRNIQCTEPSKQGLSAF